MAVILHDIYDWYRDLIDNRSDPRVKDWLMMASPLPTLALCVFYAYFSKSLGPRIMANRKPLDLRNVLIYYNLFQTIFSAWIFYGYLANGWWSHYSLGCQPVDYSNSALGLGMASTCWWYFISKFTEFFDTLFFILRKKNDHVSTLHVIHHGCMPFSVWMGMKFAPGGHSTFFALLNSFVHVVMYFYYMISAMGPKYKSFIWWKKYLTTFQMMQFVAIFVHQFQLMFRECDYPKSFMVWIGLHGIMFLFLFSDFYKAKYSRSNNKTAVLANGHAKPVTNGTVSNGTVPNGTVPNGTVPNGTVSNGKVANGIANGKHVLTNGDSNKGACMAVLDEENEEIVKYNGYKNGYANGYTNGHAFKESVLSASDAILNADGGNSSLHQRKIK